MPQQRYFQAQCHNFVEYDQRNTEYLLHMRKSSVHHHVHQGIRRALERPMQKSQSQLTLVLQSSVPYALNVHAHDEIR